MYLSKLVGERTKNAPSDVTIRSHALMLRAGFMKLVSNGIWTLAMPAKRIAKKIETIIREEMDKVEGQEVSFPVAMPRELWEMSGRYQSIGDEMVRFKDRTGRDMVLGMTHEEAAVHLSKDTVSSYNQLPYMIYQFQTKFRDEARSRGGLIRVREFIMKDAYSFHETQEDLELYYDRVYQAYTNIFRRIGMKNVVAVKSDTGMMGGSVAHEFMLLTDIGEDSIVICSKCGYKANMEVAQGIYKTFKDEKSEAISEVFTGDAKDISEVSEMLKIPSHKTIKAVCFNVKGENTIVVCFVRGDLEVNEAKLKKCIKKDIAPGNLSTQSEIVAGNIGCVNINFSDAIVLYDKSLEHTNNMVTGANKELYHITGVNMERDVIVKEYVDITKVEPGMKCVFCNDDLTVKNGIEVGNIFQLGTKYTKSMEMLVLNSQGKSFNPIMGCYGIGVGRAMASVAEESNDDKGLIWPMAIAPWTVYLCPLRIDNEAVKVVTDKLYADFKAQNIDVIYDDRNVSPGYKFSDCDLMGIPFRIVVSPRSLENGMAEIQLRDGSIKENLKIDDVVKFISEKVNELTTA